VRRWLEDEGALDAVTFPGMMLGQEKAALLKRSDCFVLPSYSENFGIAVVEAMATGLPVIISNKVNIWREIEAACAGLVVNPRAPEVADAMLAVLQNPRLAKEMGERGRRLARDKFSWRSAGSQLIRLYEQVVSRHSSTATGGMPVAADDEFRAGRRP
jgi:glycosyltransferase involved in cell wall biosynthesis